MVYVSFSYFSGVFTGQCNKVWKLDGLIFILSNIEIYTELPTCTNFVYFVHKIGNMKFVHHIQSFVHIK